MSGLGQAPVGPATPSTSSARNTKTHTARQSSISRPTRASELRSLAHRDASNSTPVTYRASSQRLPSTHALSIPSSTIGRVSTQRNISPALQATMPKRTSHDDGEYRSNAQDATQVPQLKPTLYKSAQSVSSRSLASQISPRRAGLGARTISPVEAKRARRTSRILAGDGDSAPSLGHTKISRSASGIPSPVKPPLFSRTRPSPIPPIPPLPHRLEILPVRRPSPFKVREPGRSVSGPTPSTRQRSVTLSTNQDQSHNSLQHNTSNFDKTSFTSPVKQPKISTRGAQQQMQPSNLPPMKVHSLSTPTARRVNNMSQHLAHNKPAKASSVVVPESESRPQQTPPVIQLSDRKIITPAEPAPSSQNGPREPLANEGPGTTAGEMERANSTKSKDLGGFFSRLSISRSSSRSKHKKKKSSELVETSFDSIIAEQTTPERRRRRSLSWVKGKMSPFGSSSSVPKYDSGVPPMIPKSFTSESLASQISQVSNAEAISPSKSSSRTTTDNLSVTSQQLGSLPSGNLTPRQLNTMELADEEMRRTIIASKGSKYLVEARAQAEALSARAIPRSPVDASEVATLGDNPLNLYERGEAIDYDGKIYFTGQKNLQKTGGRMDSALNVNFGYDDDRGDYLITPGDHFAYRYEIVDILGKGSFGQVLRCLDYKTGGLVAVKVIRNKQRFHAQALVEVRILKLLRQWDPNDEHHLIKYADHFYFRNHLCIATDLLGMNLYEYTKANDFKGCSLSVIRSFATQILSCLALLKTQRVIHCDLKPENILLENVWESKIKIIDFGSSCFEDQKVYTYIQSRFYRSPEVILGMTYGLPIDMWSMSCILAEMFTGYPIFPGEDEQEQLACIMEIFGPPDKHLIENSTRRKLFFDSQGKPRSVLSSKGRRRKPLTKTLSQTIKCNDEAFLDFITKCFLWNPETRLKPEQALEHPFIMKTPMVVTETSRKSKRLINNQSTHLAPRPLPKTPAQQPKIKAGYPSLRSNSSSVANNGVPTLGSPSKTHRRVVSNLPLPRERLST